MMEGLDNNTSRVIIELSNIKLKEENENYKIHFHRIGGIKDIIESYTIDRIVYEDLSSGSQDNIQKMIGEGKKFVCPKNI